MNEQSLLIKLNAAPGSAPTTNAILRKEISRLITEATASGFDFKTEALRWISEFRVLNNMLLDPEENEGYVDALMGARQAYFDDYVFVLEVLGYVSIELVTKKDKPETEVVKNYEFENGLTVPELKRIIKDWPDLDKDGKPNTVDVEYAPGACAPVFEMATSNRQVDNGVSMAGIVFSPKPETWEENKSYVNYSVNGIKRDLEPVPPIAGDLLRPHEFENGLTVTELKALVMNWPETDANGDPTEVWMETGVGLSSPVLELWPLNTREHEDGSKSADIEFSPNPEVWKEPNRTLTTL